MSVMLAMRDDTNAAIKRIQAHREKNNRHKRQQGTYRGRGCKKT